MIFVILPKTAAWDFTISCCLPVPARREEANATSISSILPPSSCLGLSRSLFHSELEPRIGVQSLASFQLDSIVKWPGEPLMEPSVSGYPWVRLESSHLILLYFLPPLPRKATPLMHLEGCFLATLIGSSASRNCQTWFFFQRQKLPEWLHRSLAASCSFLWIWRISNPWQLLLLESFCVPAPPTNLERRRSNDVHCPRFDTTEYWPRSDYEACSCEAWAAY